MNQYPENKPAPNGMAQASMIMGLLSLISISTGMFSILFGSLGILFALLSHGREPLEPKARTGLITSTGGLGFGIVMTIISFSVVLSGKI